MSHCVARIHNNSNADSGPRFAVSASLATAPQLSISKPEMMARCITVDMVLVLYVVG